MPPVHPSMGHDGYLFSHTYNQHHDSYNYEQPHSSYNPGPSQPQVDRAMEYDGDFFADMDNTPIGMSQIPLHEERVTEELPPSPRHRRSKNHSPDRFTYSEDHIYRKQTRKRM